MIEYQTLEDMLARIGDLGVGRIRDIGLLDPAVHRPQASPFGADAYLGLDEKAAVLLESLVRNHALIDSNKRIGWLATVVFHGLNNIDLNAPDDDACNLPTTWSSPSPAAPLPTEERPRSWRSGIDPAGGRTSSAVLGAPRGNERVEATLVQLSFSAVRMAVRIDGTSLSTVCRTMPASTRR